MPTGYGWMGCHRCCIAVGHEDELLAGRVEAAGQRRPVAAIGRVGHHPQPQLRLVRQLREDLPGRIATAVVDHEDLEVVHNNICLGIT